MERSCHLCQHHAEEWIRRRDADTDVRKVGAFLILRGHVKTDAEIIFGSIPAEYAPAGGSVITVPLSGTGGTANLIIYDNGDLKIKYPDPADSSKMGGGYYLDVVVGFQEGGTA